MIPDPDRFAGCLVGQALGDALGFVVEGQSPQVCRSYVDLTVRGGRAELARRGTFPFGQYSDDTQLARELLRSYVDRGGFEPGDYALRIALLFAQQRVVGRGKATEDAAKRLAAGVPWTEAGTPAPAAGNGSAMRAGPVGLMFFDDAVALCRAAHDQGRITHADPRCSAGAVAVAGAVALAMQGRPVDPRRFLDYLATWAAARDAGFAADLRRLADWVVLAPEDAVTFISRAGLPPDHRDMWPGISPFVVGSVLWSLYAFLRHPDDYMAAVCTAIAVGGDVDTTAAMTGAIAGARVGLAGIPADLAAHLTDQGDWGRAELVDLARAAWHLKTEGVRP
ncbi:MAG: ADP-ribosylglycohydrolase family protein [Hyphomicrobiales bacterium]|nr:ADP-ribosylglycohydrolase family protein [Hyphomicrobiales bacterium]MCP5371041.1 ADP-ribosylglycohydrolase family protein [Hyphomicrobiales bacterium]